MRMWNQIIELNLWHYWISASVEWDMTVTVDNATEFVTQLNVWDFEWDDTVKLDNATEFVTQLNVWDFEWDDTVKLDNTTQFVTLLNIWNCWMKWDSEIR